ncbi:MAG: lipid II flippase MurJ, partial [Sulfuriferula sp.]
KTDDSTIAAPSEGKRLAIRSAIMVSALTLIGSLGFFARDFLMTRWFGMGSEMDSFVLGAMLPMLLVTVFAVPAGAAIIPIYTSQHHDHPEHTNRFLLSAAIALSGLLAMLALALYIFLPQLFTLLNWHYSVAEFAVISDITHIYLLILWIGGLTILGNAALTAIDKVTFPTVAQLVVPVIAFIALILFGTRYSIYPVAYAMLIGATANLILVIYALNRNKLLPTQLDCALITFSQLPVRQYTFLMITALSSALLIPIANSMAATLTIGSVAIISLGIKVMLLITGVIGIGINTVLLPYFSKLIAKLEHTQAQSDFAFFLLLLTLLSVPATLLLTFLVEPMISILFANSKLTEHDLISLSKVIEYGVVQLPFFASALVASKYIAAHQRSSVIMLAALFGLIVTLTFGSILSKTIGVAGISLAMTLASAISASILVLYTNHLRHLSIMDSIFIGFNWMIFLTLFLFMHYQLYVGLFITAIAYVVLVAGNWYALINEWQYTEQAA